MGGGTVMKLEQAARSNLGLVRRRNEDSWVSWPHRADGANEVPAAVFGVADGMGGHPGGDVASALAVAAVERCGDPAGRAAEEYLREAFRAAGQAILAEAQLTPRLKEMGTTLTVLLLRSGEAWAGQIGDSRLYWIRGDRCHLLTRDHTLARDLVDRGVLGLEEADDHPSSHVLTRCLGVCPDQAPEILRRPLRPEPGDWFLLASDGLVKAVPTRQLATLLAGRGAAAAVEALEAAALAGGAPDNVTIVLVRVLDAGAPPEGSRGIPFDESERSLVWTQG